MLLLGLQDKPRRLLWIFHGRLHLRLDLPVQRIHVVGGRLRVPRGHGLVVVQPELFKRLLGLGAAKELGGCIAPRAVRREDPRRAVFGQVFDNGRRGDAKRGGRRCCTAGGRGGGRILGEGVGGSAAAAAGGLAKRRETVLVLRWMFESAVVCAEES